MTRPAEGQVEASPPRRRLRLSVRAMMAVVLVLAVVLGLMVRRAQVQRDAVAAIGRTGGSLHYGWEVTRVVPNIDTDSRRKPWCSKWLADRLGPDYFGHVAVLHLGDE